MKRITLLLVFAFLVSGLIVYSQKIEPGNVIGITQVKPADGVSVDQFEKFYLEEFIPVFNKTFTTVPFSLMKTIRGKRMNEYAEFYTFESLKERNRWFPEPGTTTDEWKKARDSMGETWNKLWDVISSLEYTDYLVLPYSGKPIDVKSGNVVTVFECEITLEEGMTFDDLEQFYQKEYGPTYMKNFPGTQFCVFKGERGDRTGKYTELMVVKSMDEFNKWLTEDGKANEKMMQAYENMGEVQAKMEKMYSYSKATSYIVL